MHNGSAAPWEARPYAQILRNDPRTKSSYFNVESYAFHGPAIYDGTKYRKLDPTSTEDAHLALDVRDGWIAALQHHFVSADRAAARGAVALHPERLRQPVPARRHRAAADASRPVATAQFSQTLFVGPKLQAQLEATAPELGRVADYGRLCFLARPLFWLLD